MKKKETHFFAGPSSDFLGCPYTASAWRIFCVSWYGSCIELPEGDVRNAVLSVPRRAVRWVKTLRRPYV
jgi:hypothetical protein